MPTGNPTMTPSSPRQIQIDPHLAAPRHPNGSGNQHHSVQISSPNGLSPSAARAHPGPLQPPPTHHRGSSGVITMARSYREDPENARERQMQQDIESAMSMSRARSGSVTAQDVSPGMRPSQMHYPSSSPIEEGTSFPMLSHMEEAALDRARRSGFRVEDAGNEESDEENHHYDERRRRRHASAIDEDDDDDGGALMDHSYHHGRGQSHPVGSGGSSNYDSHARHLPENMREMGQGGGGGMAGVGMRRPDLIERRSGMMQRSNFDFKPMEEFADQERGTAPVGSQQSNSVQWIPDDNNLRKRSTNSRNDGSAPQGDQVQPGSYDTAMERTTTMSAYGDEGDHGTGYSTKENEGGNEGHRFHRRRQRKLSQSNPVTRRQGKLALFEGFGSQGNTGAPGEESGTINGSPGGTGGSGPFKAPRQPKNLGGHNGLPPLNPVGGGFMPFTDAAPGHDKPYRFSFYSNALPVTIHARTLAELPSEGQSFEDLFKGKNNGDVKREDAQPDGTGTDWGSVKGSGSGAETPAQADAIAPNAKMSLLAKAAGAAVKGSGGGGGPPGGSPVDDDPEAFTWWLDVLSPTDEEMRMLSKVFGIHPLTTEDILLEETREKIELFRNYYLVCFRSFDQDPYSQTYLEPLNMYIIVFREGTLSFHFRGTPHPQNVRRRIKHLKDYISVTSDWISYALIDDITDAFGPLIQSIEYEVDSIDELVLILKEAEQSDMLRRIGTCRKKVMGLLRLMGNKADVVKGLAKRCNEQWLVAPKSDIGLYLSDIQDHLITMTQNLNHYEKILSRSHSNYLAQISIEMTDANNQINDVLSKLTALGTVLIPMNLVTGLWGMNVHVPGQDIETGYAWFGGILGCLALFAVLGAFATWKCFVR